MSSPPGLFCTSGGLSGPPSLQRFAAAGNSVSAERLSLAVVEVGPLVRDIVADGKVVAANSPTLYAAAGGAAVMQVHAGDTVKRGQVLAHEIAEARSGRIALAKRSGGGLRVSLSLPQ